MNFLDQAHVARLATFAQHGAPKDYAASDMMRADLEALILALAAFKPLEGRYFIRDGEWIKAAPESLIGETLYRRMTADQQQPGETYLQYLARCEREGRNNKPTTNLA